MCGRCSTRLPNRSRKAVWLRCPKKPKRSTGFWIRTWVSTSEESSVAKSPALTGWALFIFIEQQTTEGKYTMAVKLITNYAKRLGLPGYSSHQFSVSIETELPNLDNVRHESARLYESLQEVVDQQIQKTGFVPPDGYGMDGDKTGTWNCSKKQRDLIEKITSENKLDQNELDQLANEMFGAKIPALNKL